MDEDFRVRRFKNNQGTQNTIKINERETERKRERERERERRIKGERETEGELGVPRAHAWRGASDRSLGSPDCVRSL
jgi:hypothetical protein